MRLFGCPRILPRRAAHGDGADQALALPSQAADHAPTSNVVGVGRDHRNLHVRIVDWVAFSRRPRLITPQGGGRAALDLPGGGISLQLHCALSWTQLLLLRSLCSPGPDGFRLGPTWKLARLRNSDLRNRAWAVG